MRLLLIILPLTFILYACPYESAVPMEERPVELIDSSLLGYWYGIVKDGSDFFGIEALDISRHSDSVYAITRYGKAVKGDMVMPDTAYFKGYISRLDGEMYMNVAGTIVTVTSEKKNKPPVVKTQNIFYISSISIRHDTLQVRTITDNFSPVSRKGFSSSAQLKAEILSMKQQQKNIYDDTYSLSYRKIEKPQPLKPY
ncbi:MAG TPA: hypothetical protein VFZ42_01490 [Chitinophagaceae bacterium]